MVNYVVVFQGATAPWDFDYGYIPVYLKTTEICSQSLLALTKLVVHFRINWLNNDQALVFFCFNGHRWGHQGPRGRGSSYVCYKSFIDHQGRRNREEFKGQRCGELGRTCTTRRDSDSDKHCAALRVTVGLISVQRRAKQVFLSGLYELYISGGNKWPMFNLSL